MRRKLIPVLVVVLLFSILSLPGLAANRSSAIVLPVHNLNTGLDYASIQEAIDANETLSGHTIFVDAGIYNGPINITKSLHLVGDSCNSIIDAGNVTNTDGVTTNVGSVTVENFTVRNASRYGILVSVINGIYLIPVSSVRIVGNIVEDNLGAGILLGGISLPGDSVPCFNITVQGNIVRNNTDGISLRSVENSTINDNTIQYNSRNGISISGKHSSVAYRPSALIKNNVISKNGGDGIYINLDMLMMEQCRVFANVIENNTAKGIEVAGGPFQNLRYNFISDSQEGIRFGLVGGAGFYSSVVSNCFVNNSVGVYINWPSTSFENTGIIFSMNNFLNNTRHVNPTYTNSTWFDLSVGNYWDNYTGVDINEDGIGDTPNFLNLDNVDRFPLTGLSSSFDTIYGYRVSFVSNSTISNFQFSLIDPSNAELNFTVSGTTGTQGFCRICVPKVLINGPYTVLFDGVPIGPSQLHELNYSDTSYACLYIKYTHSEHMLEIDGTTTVPEFSPLLAMLLFGLVALLLYSLSKKNPF